MSHRPTLLVLSLLALAPVVRAAEPTVEERLQRIESALARLESRLNETVTADELAPTLKEYSDLTHKLGWDGKSPLTFAKPGASENKLTVGGFIHAQYEAGDAPDSRYTGINDRFLLRRTRLNLAGSFAEDVSFKLEADFGNNSIATKTGLSGQLTDAYVNWSGKPWLGLRLGQFKTPFGYEQLAADTKILTIERSLPNDRLTLGRQVGFMAFGDLVEKRLSYSVGTYNGTGTNLSSNDNKKYLWVGRLNGVVFDGKVDGRKTRLSLGADYFTTKDKGTFNGQRFGTSIDAQLVHGPAEIQAEWFQNNQHPLTGAHTTADGWAVLGAYNVTKQWQGVVRYENYDSNKSTANTTTDVWTFGINYLLKGDDLKLSLDYLTGQQPSPTPRGDRIIGRMQVVF